MPNRSSALTVGAHAVIAALAFSATAIGGDGLADHQVARALVELAEMVRREMQVEGRAIAVNLIEEDMRGNGRSAGVSTSKRRQSGSSSTDSAAFSATSLWNSGKAPSTSSKATVIAKAAALPLFFVRPVCGPLSSPRPPALRRDTHAACIPDRRRDRTCARLPRGRPHRPARSS